MKKSHGALLCLALGALGYFSHPTTAWAGAVLDRIKDKGVMVLATDPGWPPLSWRDEKGEYQGFDIDVAKEIARRMGVTLAYATPAWDEVVSGQWNDNWDIVIQSMTPTAKRAKVLDFPAVYYYGMASLAVHKDNTTILTPADASGKRLAVQKASAWEQYLKAEPFDIVGMPPYTFKIKNPVIVECDTVVETYDKLAKGDGVEIDGLIDFLPSLMRLIKEGKPFKIVGQPVFRTPQSIAIEPGDPELFALVKETIAQMRNDMTLSNLSMKWFDLDLTQP
jgi:polar amino acid transport system substrate-binding protein